jgi:hypothetical protein
MGMATVPAPFVVTLAPPAADCTNANGVSVCAQGEVRGSDGGSGPGLTGPVVPYPCD